MVAAGKMLTAILRHCAKQKRTESGLNGKTVQGKFFKDTGICVDLLVPLSRCGLREDRKVIEVSDASSLE
jgi:hypothetical protein